MKKLAVALLLACATLTVNAAELGGKFDMAKADTFETGVTTLDDAKEQLGNPVSVSTDADGNQMIWWKYVKVGVFSGRDVRKLAIVFDKEGKMLRVAHREQLQ